MFEWDGALGIGANLPPHGSSDGSQWGRPHGLGSWNGHRDMDARRHRNRAAGRLRRRVGRDMDRWRDRIRDRLAWWSLRDRLLTLAALAMVGFIVYSLVARDDGRASRTAADVTSTTHAPARDVATTLVPTATSDPATTTLSSAAPPVTPPPVTQPPVTDPPLTAPPATGQPPTTATSTPPTTVRLPATTAPPTTARVGPFCGFAPGAIVDIDLNGQPSGRQTADANGCVTVNR